MNVVRKGEREKSKQAGNWKWEDETVGLLEFKEERGKGRSVTLVRVTFNFNSEIIWVLLS